MPVDPKLGEPRGLVWEEPREDLLNWNSDISEWINPDGVLVCGAKRGAINVGRTKPDPMRCAGTGKMQNGRCVRHAGNAAKGSRSGQFKDGRVSKFMPKGILDKFHEVANDPLTKTLEFESSILMMRVVELVRGLPQRTSIELWTKSLVLLGQWEEASDAADLGEMVRVMDTLKMTLRSGADATESWGQIIETVEARRKVAAVENRRRAREVNTITMEEAMTLVHGVIHTVSEIMDKHEIPPFVRDEIADALIRLTNARDRAGIAVQG